MNGKFGLGDEFEVQPDGRVPALERSFFENKPMLEDLRREPSRAPEDPFPPLIFTELGGGGGSIELHDAAAERGLDRPPRTSSHTPHIAAGRAAPFFQIAGMLADSLGGEPTSRAGEGQDDGEVLLGLSEEERKQALLKRFRGLETRWPGFWEKFPIPEEDVKKNPGGWLVWLIFMLRRLVLQLLADPDVGPGDLQGESFLLYDGRVVIYFGEYDTRKNGGWGVNEQGGTTAEIIVVLTPSGKTGIAGEGGELPPEGYSDFKDFSALDGKDGGDGGDAGSCFLSVGSNKKVFVITGQGGAGGTGGPGANFPFEKEEGRMQTGVRDFRCGSGGRGGNGGTGGDLWVIMADDCEFLSVDGPSGSGGKGGDAGWVVISKKWVDEDTGDLKTQAGIGDDPFEGRQIRLAVGGDGGDGHNEPDQIANMEGDHGLLVRSRPGGGGKGGERYRVTSGNRNFHDGYARHEIPTEERNDRFQVVVRAYEKRMSWLATRARGAMRRGNSATEEFYREIQEAMKDRLTALRGGEGLRRPLFSAGVDGYPGFSVAPRVSANIKVIEGDQAQGELWDAIQAAHKRVRGGSVFSAGFSAGLWDTIAEAATANRKSAYAWGSGINSF